MKQTISYHLYWFTFMITTLLISLSVSWPVVAVLVYIAGAKELFYKLHTLVFPVGHQWFFYYEESLMSMMMKAPDMFSYIAIMLVLLALPITLTIFWLIKYMPLTIMGHQVSLRPV